MSDAYTRLFTFVVEHGFYDDGFAPGLEFTPSAETERMMRNTGLLLRPIAGGIAVLCSSKDRESLQLHVVDGDEPLALTFKVNAKDTSIESCTDLESGSDHSILYFDSLEGRQQHDGRTRLHDDEYISIINHKRLDTDPLRNILDRRERRLPPLFVVDIRVTEDALRSAGGRDGVATGNYYIKFRERQVFWKYYLLGPLARESLFLSDLDNKASFVFSGRETVGNTHEAVTYRSVQRLPLRATPQYRFQLREKENGNEKVVIKRLPVAAALRFGRATIDGRDEVVSEIYINC